jgi:ABC-type transporter Mla maintaining outer membrane lipid asymmetry ATPase subunit MlaF
MGAATFVEVNNSSKKKQGIVFQNTALFIILSVKTRAFTNCGFMTCTDTLMKKNWSGK